MIQKKFCPQFYLFFQLSLSFVIAIAVKYIACVYDLQFHFGLHCNYVIKQQKIQRDTSGDAEVKCGERPDSRKRS